MKLERVYKMKFSDVYPLYIQKVERKGREKSDVDAAIFWLTGYDKAGLSSQIESAVTLEEFFAAAPCINPRASEITGKICGVRIEEITEPLMQKIRQLDKLIDDIAKGKPLEKILPK